VRLLQCDPAAGASAWWLAWFQDSHETDKNTICYGRVDILRI
jgi:hypothetical protein